MSVIRVSFKPPAPTADNGLPLVFDRNGDFSVYACVTVSPAHDKSGQSDIDVKVTSILADQTCIALSRSMPGATVSIEMYKCIKAIYQDGVRTFSANMRSYIPELTRDEYEMTLLRDSVTFEKF
jgi:hypothetical protein